MGRKTSLKAWLDHVGIDVGAEDSKDGDGGGAPRPARALERQDSSAVRREQIHDHEQVRRALGVHFDLSRRRSVPLRTLAASLDRYDEKGARFAFEPGDVVECEGPDQRWRLAVVTRASAGGYSVVSAGGYSHGYGRSRPAPRVAERATVAIFGDGPLTWRTYALVRLEERVRIQEGHCDDFEDFDFEAFAREAWTAWLDDGRNASFKKGFDAASPGARAALVDLCLDPFRRLDGIKSWDFEEPASVYLYLACTGSGVLSALSALLLQVGIPTLVLLFQLRAGRSEPPAICKDRAGSISSRGEGARFTAVMILLVIYFYAVKVIPDAYCKFLETGGGGDGVARLAALRALIFRAEVDSVLQKVGFRVWRVMNGGYEVLLYSLNLYVLFYHHSPLEVILNSLAIEFILEIDERLADPKGGYDPDLRYLRSSAVELTLRQHVPSRRLRRLGIGDATLKRASKRETRDHWARHYGLHHRSFRGRLRASMSASTRGSFKTPAGPSDDDAIDDMLDDYDGLYSGTDAFGYVATLLRVRGHFFTKGIFGRFVAYRDWTRWDEHLFAPAKVAPWDPKLFSAAAAEVPYAVLEGFESSGAFTDYVVGSAPRLAARLNRTPRLGDLLKTASLQRLWFAATGRNGDGDAVEGCTRRRRALMTIDAVVEYLNAVVVLFGFPFAAVAVAVWVPLCYGPERPWPELP